MNDHFTKIFWLLAGALTLSFTYIFAITFLHIPKENIRFADTAQGFLLGTVIGGVIAFFCTGSPPQAKKQDSSPAGTTTINAEVSATTTPIVETKD